MWCADGDKDTGVADFEAAQSVDDGYTMNRKLFMEKLANFVHFLQRHGSVGFVFEIAGLAAVGLVADKSIEGDDGAIDVRADESG